MVTSSASGASLDSIDTPALVVDLDAMERNIARMASFAAAHHIRWRPHAKMHKSAALALQMMAAGAVGVCVQKTAEAEAMLAGGVGDIYISNEVVSLSKLERVAGMIPRLAAQNTSNRLAIAVDSAEGVRRLAEAVGRVAGTATGVIDVFVEIDVGQGRCGVPPGPPAVALAQQISQHPQLNFAGLQAYHGRAQHLRSHAERQEAIAEVLRQVQATRALIEAAGLKVGLVTGAGTGTMALEAASGIYGELQAGSFLFMDADYAANEADPNRPAFEHALFVKTQVISASLDQPVPHVVCDAGHKSHAIDSGLPKVFRPAGGPALEYFNGGDEHGILRTAEAGQPLPALGDVVWLIPGHCDPTVNLHDQMIGVRGGLVAGRVERVIRVDARGALT